MLIHTVTESSQGGLFTLPASKRDAAASLLPHLPNFSISNLHQREHLANHFMMSPKDQVSIDLPIRQASSSISSNTQGSGDAPTQRVDLINILEFNYPIFDALCEQLDIAGLIKLRMLSKRLEQNWQTHSKKRWNVNAKLRRFVDDPVGLRAAMSEHHALISGSFVVQLMGNWSWPDSDLDIYIRYNNASAFEKYLEEKEEYILSDQYQLVPDKYGWRNLMGVKTYTRSRNGKEEQVQVIKTSEKPINCIVGDFHSSCVVNVLTHATCYSLFPRWTFCEPYTSCLGDLYDEAKQKCIDKYEARGWRFMNDINQACRLFRKMNYHRYVADRGTWILNLDAEQCWPRAVHSLDGVEGVHFFVNTPRMLTESENAGRPLVKSGITMF